MAAAAAQSSSCPCAALSYYYFYFMYRQEDIESLFPFRVRSSGRAGRRSYRFTPNRQPRARTRIGSF